MLALEQVDLNSSFLLLLSTIVGVMAFLARDAYKRLQKDTIEDRQAFSMDISNLKVELGALRDRSTSFELRYTEAHNRDIGAAAAENRQTIGMLSGKVDTLVEMIKLLQEHDREHTTTINRIGQWMAESKEAVRSIDVRLTNIERTLRSLRGGRYNPGNPEENEE